MTQASTTLTFTITPTGQLEYDSSYDNVATGRTTSTLTITGLPVNFNLTNTDYSSFSISGNSTYLTTNQTQTRRLLPGKHVITTTPWDTFAFTVTAIGHVDYDPSLDGILPGRGTATLILRRRQRRRTVGGILVPPGE